MSRASESLSFYPPRANWFGRTKNRLLNLVPASIRFREDWKPPICLILALFVPGAGLILAQKAGWKSWALGSVTWLTILLFFVHLGETQAQLWLLISVGLHSFSFSLWLRRTFPKLSTVKMVIVSTISLALYYGTCFFLVNFMFFPVSFEGKLLLVSRLVPTSTLEVGDTIYYSINDWPNTAGKILAKSGDAIEFMPTYFLMNGNPYERLNSMPRSGRIIVPEERFFIWPTTLNFLQERRDLTELYVKASIVSPEQIRGAAVKSWFGRARENL